MHTHHIECLFPAGVAAERTFRVNKRGGSHAHWAVRVVSGNVPGTATLRFQGVSLLHSDGSDLIAVGPDATEAVPVNYSSGPLTLRLADFAGTTLTPAQDVLVLVELIEA